MAVVPLGTNEGHILVVGYSNGNIDLLTESGVYNMPDIVNSNLIGDKSIRKIFVEGTKAYLSTGFGVVVIDVTNIEVSDTWYINGQQALLGATGVYSRPNKWVVSTDEGVYEASKDQIESYLSAVASEFPEITSLLYVINQKGNDTLYDQDIIVFKKGKYIRPRMSL